MIRRAAPMKRNVLPSDERCLRSRCQRRGVVIEGRPRLCLAHQAKLGRSRFGVERVAGVGGTSHQSVAEADGMAEVYLREKLGELGNIREQVMFWLYIGAGGQAFLRCTRLFLNLNRKGVRIEGYKADVVLDDHRTGHKDAVWDFKHRLLTDEFKKKSRWMNELGYPVIEKHKGQR